MIDVINASNKFMQMIDKDLSNSIILLMKSILISFFLNLKSKYCLSSRYKQVSGFFEDFGILRERYMNDSDINSIVIESFEVNISN
ncbi:hypothetical protein BpHYR1_036373, partial [Brachionus plicatilis]